MRLSELASSSAKTKVRQVAKMKFKLLDVIGEGMVEEEEVAVMTADTGVLMIVRLSNAFQGQNIDVLKAIPSKINLVIIQDY